MGQLVGNHGGKQRLGEIHVDIGLGGEGTEKARIVDDAHDAGKEHPLGRHLRSGEAGKALCRRAEDPGGPFQHRLPVGAAQAVFVPRHPGGIIVEQVRKVQRRQLKLLGGDIVRSSPLRAMKSSP